MILKKFAIATLIVLTGCASQPKNVAPKPLVKRIAILPVEELTTVSLENKNSAMFVAPIVSAGVYLDSKSKQKVLSEKLLSQHLTLGSDLTATLAQSLEKRGFQVSILREAPRLANDPDEIDYANIDADAVLHVHFDDVGLFSGLTSSDYLPRVNINVALHSTKRNEDIYGETLCYGVDARAGNTWAIAADPKFAYPSFENVLARLPDVVEAFKAGTQAIGERTATEIESAVK